MRRIVAAALGLWLGASGLAHAQIEAQAAPAAVPQPVVVELYTSQGCSACPPADAILADLAPREDVIALALHVDYWDYIGWADAFADPAFTRRQKAYAKAAGARSIYTPQMIVAGQEHLIGVRPLELAELIRAHAARPSPVRLRLERQGAVFRIVAEAEPPLGRKVVVQLVRYRPEQTVEISHGENAGLRVSYANIVTDWQPLAEWDGQGIVTLEAPAEGEDPAVAIVQESGPGAILAAARLR